MIDDLVYSERDTIYSIEFLRAEQKLLQASVGQAEDLGKFGAARSLTDQSVQVANKIDRAVGAIAIEGLPLSLGSYALEQRGRA